MPLPSLPAEADAALTRFRTFYAEISEVKRIIGEQDWDALIGQRAASTGISDQLLRSVQTRLRRAIAAQAGTSTVFGSTGPAGIDPEYVMTAVADEVLLHEVSWPARDAWAETPLEALLYRTRIAGDRIFQAVDAICAQNAPDTEGVGVMILLALQVGFRGRYRGTDDHGALQAARDRLFTTLFRGRYRSSADPGELVAGNAAPMADRRSVTLQPLRPWTFALLGLALLYLLISYKIWYDQVEPVADSASRIIGSQSQLSP